MATTSGGSVGSDRGPPLSHTASSVQLRCWFESDSALWPLEVLVGDCEYSRCVVAVVVAGESGQRLTALLKQASGQQQQQHQHHGGGRTERAQHADGVHAGRSGSGRTSARGHTGPVLRQSALDEGIPRDDGQVPVG